MNIEHLKKKREKLRQELAEIDEKIRLISRKKDLQKLAEMSRILHAKGFIPAQIEAARTRKRRSENA